MAIELRNQRITDARRFYELLNNPNFKYGPPCPPSVEAEKEWLRKNAEKREKKKEWNYSIIVDGEMAGGCGIVKCKDEHIAELGYFIGEEYWGKGITPKAVEQLERIAFRELGFKRLEIVVHVDNKASRRVAEKSGYELEGICKKRIELNGRYHDACLYSKVR